MLCDKCGKRNATVFYESVGARGREKLSLCESCAKSALPGSETGSRRFFSPLFPLPGQGSGKSCPFCGMTLEEIARFGGCGCPGCYTTFEEELTPTLRALHDAIGHTGRMPARFLREKERRERLAFLRTELKTAIEEENYEKCPALRDAIRALAADVEGALGQGSCQKQIS